MKRILCFILLSLINISYAIAGPVRLDSMEYSQTCTAVAIGGQGCRSSVDSALPSLAPGVVDRVLSVFVKTGSVPIAATASVGGGSIFFGGPRAAADYSITWRFLVPTEFQGFTTDVNLLSGDASLQVTVDGLSYGTQVLLAGLNSVSFGFNAVGSSIGLKLIGSSDASARISNVTANQQSASVPEPKTLLLVLAALTFLALTAITRRKMG